MTSYTPADIKRIQWHPSPDDSSLMVRQAAGGELVEDIWNRFLNGEQTLFVALDITLHSPIDHSKFLAYAHDAWSALRFELPHIALGTTHDKDGTCLMTYRVPDDKDAEVWAKRTCQLSQFADLDELRYELGQKAIPDDNGDQTFLHVLPRTDESSYGLLFHTSHIPFDGAGTKITMNKFLGYLTASISGIALERDWGTEVKHLIPSVFEILGPSEGLATEEYKQTLGSVMTDTVKATARQYGFKPRTEGVENGPTRRIGHTFSLEDSTKIAHTARQYNLSVNHLLHSALVTVAALDNPPTDSSPSDAAIVNWGLVDGRNRLKEPWSSTEGYTGYCLGVSVIQYPLSLFPKTPPSTDKEMKELLLNVGAVAQVEYAKQKAYPSLLAIGWEQCDMLKAAIMAGPPPPPWMGPWYSGDGIERYLQPKHKDTSGNDIITVNDFFISLNKHNPGPFFRASSWQGKLKLSVDTNDKAMPGETVQEFMNKWAEIILAFIA